MNTFRPSITSQVRFFAGWFVKINLEVLPVQLVFGGGVLDSVIHSARLPVVMGASTQTSALEFGFRDTDTRAI